MLIHFINKCNGVIVEREDDCIGAVRLWTVNSKCDKQEIIYDFKKSGLPEGIETIPNVQCIECGKTWLSSVLAAKECYSFSYLAEKNLKLIFTSIMFAISALFLCSVFLNELYLKTIVFSVSFFIVFIISISKQLCEITEINSTMVKIHKKYKNLFSSETPKEKGGTNV